MPFVKGELCCRHLIQHNKTCIKCKRYVRSELEGLMSKFLYETIKKMKETDADKFRMETDINHNSENYKLELTIIKI